MDTRSKSFRYSAVAKLLAAIICICGMLVLCFGLLKAPYFESALSRGEYLGSATNATLLRDHLFDLSQILYYGSEENIKSGSLLEDDLKRRKEQIQNITNHKIADINNQYSYWIQRAKESGNDKEVSRLEAERDSMIEAERQAAEAELEKWKQNKIQDQLKSYLQYKNRLESAEGIYYYGKTPEGNTVSNIGIQDDVKAFFESLPVYTSMKENVTVIVPAVSGPAYYSINLSTLLPEGTQIYAGMSQERFDTEKIEYEKNKTKGFAGICQFAAGFVLFVTGLCYLLYSAGIQPDSEEIRLLVIDRLYLDVGLCIVATIIAAPIVIAYNSRKGLYTYMANPTLAFYILGALLVTCVTIPVLIYLTTVAKRIKRREFWRSNLIFKIPAYILKRIRELFLLIRRLINAGPLNTRTALMFLVYASATAISLIITIGSAIEGSGAGALVGIILTAAVNIAAFVYMLKKAQALNDITAGVERIRSGNFSSRISVGGGEEMENLAESINRVADGLKSAVENEVKAERLKTELVTNVSHDLKTPLTSIITYIDLLKTEGLKSENAERYLGIIEQKTNRLKTLTEDLFEAAKAASGNIKINTEQLDAGALLMQGLGELTDRINASGLEFKINIPEDKVLVEADGRLLWRVVENLLSNVFKYALAGSRVYIDLIKDAGKAHIVIKNISAYELNMSPEELTERFTRGDQSRNSEGSGLGLSIAKSLTELQGGKFTISIDGDLFKATVTLPAYESPVREDESRN